MKQESSCFSYGECQGYGPGPALNEKFYNTFYNAYKTTGSGCVIDNTKVSFQGHGDWAVICDKDGYFLYFDKDTGKRMKSLTNNPADEVEDSLSLLKQILGTFDAFIKKVKVKKAP